MRVIFVALLCALPALSLFITEADTVIPEESNTEDSVTSNPAVDSSAKQWHSRLDEIKRSNRYIRDQQQLQAAHASYSHALSHANELLAQLEDTHSDLLEREANQQEENAPQAAPNKRFELATEGALVATRGEITCGVGTIPKSCLSGHELNGLLCYPKCRPGYSNFGCCICKKNCPSGFSDNGLGGCNKPGAIGRGAGHFSTVACEEAVARGSNRRLLGSGPPRRRTPRAYGSCEKNGLLLYPKCSRWGSFHNVGCCICSPNCPPGFRDGGVFCLKDSYGRGAGKSPECAPGLEKVAGLCYKHCPCQEKCGDNTQGWGFSGCNIKCPSKDLTTGVCCKQNIFKSLFNSAKEAVAKSIEAVKSVISKIGDALSVLKQITDLIAAGAKTVICVLKEVSKSFVGDFKALIGDPDNYLKQLSGRLENFLPKILEATSKGVSGSIYLMKKIFNGDTIDFKQLAGTVAADVRKMGKLDPVIACAMPLIKKVEDVINAGSQLELMQTDSTHGITLAQLKARSGTDVFKVVTNWLIAVPWGQGIKPLLTQFWNVFVKQVIPQAGKAIIGQRAFDEVQAGVQHLVDSSLTQTSKTVTLKLQAFSNSVSQSEKAKVMSELKGLLTGKLNFADLLQGGVAALKSTVKTIIMAWVQKSLPAWWDWIVEKASAGLLQIASFVAEEILAEPAPFTMWGMEGIGSGVSEPVKSAWNVVTQLAGGLFAKAVPFLFSQLIDVLFALPELGAKLGGKALDKDVMPALKGFGAQIERWIGSIKELFKQLPPEITNIVSELGKQILSVVTSNISPKIKQTFDTNIAIFKTIYKEWKCAGKEASCHKAVLLQLDLDHPEIELEEIRSGMLEPLKRGFQSERAHPTFQEHLEAQKDMPGWMHRHFTAHFDPQVHVTPSLADFSHALIQVHKQRFPNLQADKAKGTVEDARRLIDSSKKLPNMLDSSEKLLQQVLAQSKGTDMEPRMHQLLSKVWSTKQHLKTGPSVLMQSSFITEMQDFFKKSIKLFKCLMLKGTAQMASYTNDMRGKTFVESVNFMTKVFEDNLEAVFGGIASTFKTALAKIGTSLDSGKFMDVEQWSSLIISGIDQIGVTVPAMKCFDPIIKATIIASAAALKSFTNVIGKSLDSWVGKLVESVFVKGFVTVVNTAGKFLLGASYNRMELSVSMGVDGLLQGIMKQVHFGLTKLRDMPPGKEKTLALDVLKKTLQGKVSFAQTADLIWGVLRDTLISWVQAQVDSWMPQIFEWVADIGGNIGIPAASVTVGVNVAIATGSCASEWIGTALSNIVQAIYSFVESLGKQAIPAVVNFLTVGLMTEALDGLYKFVGKPLIDKVLKPADKLANKLIDGVKAKAKKVMGIIPPEVLQVLKDIAKIAIKKLKQRMSPKLQQQYDHNQELLRVLTGSVVPVAAPTIKGSVVPVAASVASSINISSISLAIPHKSLRDTPDLVSSADIDQDPVGEIERDPTVIKNSKAISERQANNAKPLAAAVKKDQAAVAAATKNVDGRSNAQVKAALKAANGALASDLQKLKEAMPVGDRQNLQKAQDAATKALQHV